MKDEKSRTLNVAVIYPSVRAPKKLAIVVSTQESTHIYIYDNGRI